jgi:hypothetical protein
MEEPPFPDYPCDGCGKSFVDMEQEEEAQQKALEKEQTRIESGAVYRRLEQEHAHQNNKKHTAASYFTRDSNYAFHPKNLADALRMGSRNVATTNFAVASRRTCATGTGGIGADDDMGTASVDLFLRDVGWKTMRGLAVRYRTQRNGSIVHVGVSRVVQLEVPPGKL